VIAFVVVVVDLVPPFGFQLDLASFLLLVRR